MLSLLLSSSSISRQKYDVDPSDLIKQRGRVEAFAKHEERYMEDKDKIKSRQLSIRHESKFIGDNVRKIPAKLCQAYADALPLAFEVLGCFLCGRDADQWRSAIERFRSDSNKEILDRLRISFDGLEETEKNIFLDIACFFNGEGKDFVIKVLDGCEELGIDVLVKKSLLTVDEDNKLRMHNWLVEMGRRIAKKECDDEPGKRCRLWEEEDVCHVLTKNTATEAIEGMVIDIRREQNKTFALSADAFSKMKKLKLLRVLSAQQNPDDHLKYLSNNLRLLDWKGYPFKSLPSSFEPDNLVILSLPYSRIQRLWKKDTLLSKLKLVNLEGSIYLIKTPDFTRAPNLESLILEGCTKIVDVRFGVHSKLKVLNLKGCKSLSGLPTQSKMESLEILVLSGCSKLQRLPQIVLEMKKLLEIYLDGTSIEELPSWIEHLCELKLLNLKDCKSLRSLPTKITGLESLEKLILSGCSNVQKFPEIDGGMKSLQELYLDRTGIEELPPSIGDLSSLLLLTLENCKKLASLPSSIDGCKNLKTLILSGCSKVETLPENLQQVETLEELDIRGTAIREPPFVISEFKNLEVLSLNGYKGPPSKVRSSLHSQSKSKTLEWVLLITNCILEIPSAAFDQLSSKKHPHYALTVMVISFIALMTCIGEFVYKGIKKRVMLQWRDKVPWFYCPRTGKPLGTFLETIGLACAFCQCILIAINYSYISRYIDGPIKISVLPIIFAFGLLCSKYLEKRNENRGNTSQHEDSYELLQVVTQQ